MKIKKNKLIQFVNIILSKKSDNLKLDDVSIENYKLAKYIIENTDIINIDKLELIVKESESILDKMSIAYEKFKDNNFKFIKSESTNYSKIRNELFRFPSYNENKAFEIKEEINKIKEKHIYFLKIKDITLNLYFYSNDDSDFENLARIIYVLVYVFGQNSKNLDKYNIRFLLIDFPRILDSTKQENQEGFKNLAEKGYFNNSSGVNRFLEKELVVTRKSGINGLLIHELIHMLGLDFCYNFNNNNHINISNWKSEWVNNNNIREKNNNINSFIESICNTNSCYFLALYNSVHICNKLSNPKSEKCFKYLFYLETLYCFINSVKLLNYFGYNTYDSIFNNTNNKTFYQNALVFEYIILRMFIMSRYYKLLFSTMIKYNFNKETTDKINTETQINLNKKLLSLAKNKVPKENFDQISSVMKNFKQDKIYMEYFLTNF